MRRLHGLPPNCLPLGEVTFRHRGVITFQVKHHRWDGWFCHDGFQLPPNLSQRKFNRDWNLAANDPGMLSMMREDGWGSLTKLGCVRKVCRAIDAALDESLREDAAYLERKGVRE